MNAVFAYNNIPSSRTNYSNVKLCFQDNPGGGGNFFFLSDLSFFSDWQNFVEFIDKNNVGRNSFNFEIMPFSNFNPVPDGNNDYRFIFDMQLFDSYDGNPIKVYRSKSIDFCDVFLGSYFISK